MAVGNQRHGSATASVFGTPGGLLRTLADVGVGVPVCFANAVTRKFRAAEIRLGSSEAIHMTKGP